jgi:hypothetical protein
MRSHKQPQNPLSICRNFVGFEGIYERSLNERAIRFPDGAYLCIGRCNTMHTA